MRLSLLIFLAVLCCGDVAFAQQEVLANQQATRGEFGYSTMNKFGMNQDIDSAEESVWIGDDLIAGAARCDFGTTSLTIYISSDNAADTEAANVIPVVEGLDNNFQHKRVRISAAENTDGDGGMSGVTFVRVGAVLTWSRINRVYNDGTGSTTGNVYVHVDSTDTGGDGIPDSASDLRAAYLPTEEQSQQACYSIPAGQVLQVSQACVRVVAGGGGNPIDFRFRYHPPNGKVSRNQGRIPMDGDIGLNNCDPIDPPLQFPGGGGLEITAQSDGAAANENVWARFNGVLAVDRAAPTVNSTTIRLPDIFQF